MKKKPTTLSDGELEKILIESFKAIVPIKGDIIIHKIFTDLKKKNKIPDYSIFLNVDEIAVYGVKYSAYGLIGLALYVSLS